MGRWGDGEMGRWGDAQKGRRPERPLAAIPNLFVDNKKFLPCWNPLAPTMGYPRVTLSPRPRLLFNFLIMISGFSPIIKTQSVPVSPRPRVLLNFPKSLLYFFVNTAISRNNNPLD
ncbi:hypothetical protein MiSe_39970 [Microseira wollei NIES-4236]|uniref:Uncharacterized protein n=1 Tax=Microseira wollei NIES-4236 TaxID=2530354 RepID=A0AAV3X9Y5_9CYAN|nr:hypothetical protein MiSe_39970 [Microseira wollei NIES-4236]